MRLDVGILAFEFCFWQARNGLVGSAVDFAKYTGFAITLSSVLPMNRSLCAYLKKKKEFEGGAMEKHGCEGSK